MAHLKSVRQVAAGHYYVMSVSQVAAGLNYRFPEPRPMKPGLTGPFGALCPDLRCFGISIWGPS